MDVYPLSHSNWADLDFDSSSSEDHSSPSSATNSDSPQPSDPISPPASVWPKEYPHLSIGIIASSSILDHNHPPVLSPWESSAKTYSVTEDQLLPLTLNNDFWNPPRSTTLQPIGGQGGGQSNEGYEVIDPSSTILPKEEPREEQLPLSASTNGGEDGQDMDLDPSPTATAPSPSSSLKQTQTQPPPSNRQTFSHSTTVPTPTTNLVSKDAIISSSIITTLCTPSLSSIFPSTASSSVLVSPIQLLVLGVPTTGAKSRVETQIKISLVLVRPKGGVKLEGGLGSWLTEDGGIADKAGDGLERIGTWTHIKLPQWAALKKGKKKTAAAAKQQQGGFFIQFIPLTLLLPNCKRFRLWSSEIFFPSLPCRTCLQTEA